MLARAAGGGDDGALGVDEDGGGHLADEEGPEHLTGGEGDLALNLPLGHGAADEGLARLEGEEEEADALGLELLPDGFELGKLPSTGVSPGDPEVDDPGLAAKLLGAEERPIEEPGLEVGGEGLTRLVVVLAPAREEGEGGEDEEDQAAHDGGYEDVEPEVTQNPSPSGRGTG